MFEIQPSIQVQDQSK
jgi:hypothetical protein